MAYDPERHHRRSIRLADYDYAQNGAYYVTLCTHERECLFGEIDGDGQMRLNEYGGIVQEEWERTGTVRANVILDEFVIMPNHLHGILVITGMDGRGMARHARTISNHAPTISNHARTTMGDAYPITNYTQPMDDARPRGDAPTPTQRQFAQPVAGSLATIVGAFKSAVSRRINCVRETPGFTVWHRNYYERIIRNEEMLEKARRYIENNPARWADDVNHPANIG